MAQVFADTGIDWLFKGAFNKIAPSGGDNLTLRLFANDVTPTSASTPSTFTEAAGGGYAAKTLTSGSWTVSTVGGITQAAYAEQTFTFTGALTTNTTIYGYYITNADNVLVTAERLPASFTPNTNGDTVKVTPLVQGSYGTPTA